MTKSGLNELQPAWGQVKAYQVVNRKDCPNQIVGSDERGFPVLGKLGNEWDDEKGTIARARNVSGPSVARA
jgi:hypothetical protein